MPRAGAADPRRASRNSSSDPVTYSPSSTIAPRPTWPSATSPVTMKTSVAAPRTIATPPVSALARSVRTASGKSTSTTPKIVMLNMFDPSTVPTAMSG